MRSNKVSGGRVIFCWLLPRGIVGGFRGVTGLGAIEGVGNPVGEGVGVDEFVGEVVGEGLAANC